MKKIIYRVTTACICVIALCQSVCAARLLIPGGQVVGLELADDSVVVAAFDETLGSKSEKAGLRVGDKITHINQQPVQTPEDVKQALTRSDGTVKITILRNGKAKQISLAPEITTYGPRLGVYLRQGVTGVGTVTWYDPDTGDFAALGHGVNDKNGNLTPMKQGNVYEAKVASVQKGKVGKPGQLLGMLNNSEPIGELTKNTSRGVFGTLKADWKGEKLPVADAQQVHTGEAVIRATVADDQMQEYSVEILKIYPDASTNGRNMLLKVTDQALLETTGGIVQGMSGSPIIQDGKLVGAVTHVLVNDPTTGYGIFIENMLDAAA